MGHCTAVIVGSGLALAAGNPFYDLTGMDPTAFSNRERVPLMVSKVTSTKTQIPYEYYALPYCVVAKKRAASKATGEQPSNFELFMKVPDACKLLCRKEHDRQELRLFRAMIDNEYRNNWSVGGLPAAMRSSDGYVTRGFPVGFWLGGETGDPERQDGEDAPTRRHYLYNHLRFTVSYHEDMVKFKGARIVGFDIEPFSIKHDYDRASLLTAETPLDTCNAMRPATHDSANLQSVDGTVHDIIYTYDVKWVASITPWSRRWEVYLQANPDDEIHYFSIVNSLMIVLFLTGVVATIMLRTLRKDISAYNENAALEDTQEESGWKLLHGDIFRPPPAPATLAVCVGTGAQIFVITFAVMMLALLGFLSPVGENRGRLLLTTLLSLFVFTSCIAGYIAGRLYRLFQGKHDWKWLALLTATAYPAIIFIVCFYLEALLRAQGSSANTFPTAQVFSALLLLIFVSLPLVFAGTNLAFYHSAPLEPPTSVSQTARHIPLQLWYTHPVFAIAFGGVLPFGAVCIELFFIMSALWLEQIYYVFGFLVVVLFILVATCAEMTIVMTYFQLCNEDYRWWWRAFLSSASAAAYLFLYAVWYFVAKLDISGLAPALLYFGYMALVTLTFFLLCGAIGFAAALAFVFKIYAAIKVD